MYGSIVNFKELSYRRYLRQLHQTFHTAAKDLCFASIAASNYRWSLSSLLKFGEPGKHLLLYKMRAPSSTSLLSKAYNFLKGKTSQNDENFYAKTKSPFPSEIYHTLSEPIDQKRGPSISRKNWQILGEISNRPWSVAMDREKKQQSLSKGRFSSRAMVKNYWTIATSGEEKKLNNEIQKQPKNGKSQDQEYDDIEEEGIFKIQVCGLLFHLKVSKSHWKLGFL